LEISDIDPQRSGYGSRIVECKDRNYSMPGGGCRLPEKKMDHISQLWYFRYIVFRGPASISRSTSSSSMISNIARYSPVRIEYSPFPFPFSGPSFSLGLLICSSSARADSRDFHADTGSLARSCFAPGEIITVNLLKRVSKVCHYFRKCLAFPFLVIFSCLIHPV